MSMLGHLVVCRSSGSLVRCIFDATIWFGLSLSWLDLGPGFTTGGLRRFGGMEGGGEGAYYALIAPRLSYSLIYCYI